MDEIEESTSAVLTNILAAAPVEAAIDRIHLAAAAANRGSIAGIVVEKATHSGIALFGRKP